MPAVFVHGVPDTERVWRAVLGHLGRADTVTLSLPGFGCPAPDGFAATKEAYVDWLIAQLAELPGPLDLVGHDWGARDPYAEPRFGRRLAERTGARFVELPCSHWWQLERPDAVAHELRALWLRGR